MHMTIIGICAVHLTNCCNTCSTHNPTLVRGMQALNLCTYICCIFLCRIPLLCGSTVCFAQMKDFNQAPTYKIKHHYEQETDKILRTNQFGDRWDVLSSPSTYITRPRWIYSRRSRIQKSISVQATKLVGFCDYFLHSHALERYTDRVKIVNLFCTAPLGQKNRQCAMHSTFYIPHYSYSCHFTKVSFIFIYFYFIHSCVLCYPSHPCVSLSFEAVFHLFVLKTTTCQTRQRKKKRAAEHRVGCQSHPWRRRDKWMQTEKYAG